MDSSLQSRLHLWRQRNFPNSDADQQLLGVVEEIGELAHAVLKRKQGIRGTPEEHRAAILDAVGDIQIFLAGFCSYEGINMEYQYTYTAREVMERDWIKYPLSGKNELKPPSEPSLAELSDNAAHEDPLGR